MTKREFLDIVFALAPTEANAIMDAFDEYVDSNEPHWIPVTERLPESAEDDLEYPTVLVCFDNGDVGTALRDTHNVLQRRHPNCPLVKVNETLFNADNARKFLRENPSKEGEAEGSEA